MAQRMIVTDPMTPPPNDLLDPDFEWVWDNFQWSPRQHEPRLPIGWGGADE